MRLVCSSIFLRFSLKGKHQTKAPLTFQNDVLKNNFLVGSGSGFQVGQCKESSFEASAQI